MRYPYDHPGVYSIHIAGRLDKSWTDYLGEMKVTFSEPAEAKADSEIVTILTGTLPDQAALYGILNTLYNQRYPLLFVRYLRPG